MEARFAEERYEEGALAGIRAISAVLGRHFPSTGVARNELSDRPVMM
jgi:uncharacterized membrane protein